MTGHKLSRMLCGLSEGVHGGKESGPIESIEVVALGK